MAIGKIIVIRVIFIDRRLKINYTTTINTTITVVTYLFASRGCNSN